MSLFNRIKSSGGFMDQIRCDEPNYLIWRWHPTGSQSGNNARETAIRWGSSLRVKDGEVAVFVYKQKDGSMQDFIEGPFDQTIKTANLPVLASIVGLAYDGGTPFQAEVYFINLARIIQVKFGVPFFDVYDPRFDDFGVPVAVRGSAGYYKDLIGKDFKTVEAHFEAAGFTDIQLVDLEDSGLMFWNKGKVDTISVGGDTSFESSDWFYPDTKVIISYH